MVTSPRLLGESEVAASRRWPVRLKRVVISVLPDRASVARTRRDNPAEACTSGHPVAPYGEPAAAAFRGLPLA